MGISYSLDTSEHRWVGTQRVQVVTATFDGSYTSGGEALNPSDADLATIEHVDVVEGTTAKGYVVRWDKANGTLQAFEAAADGNPLDEVAAGKADLNNETIDIRVWGRS